MIGMRTDSTGAARHWSFGDKADSTENGVFRVAFVLFRSEPDGVNELPDGITCGAHIERGDHGV